MNENNLNDIITINGEEYVKKSTIPKKEVLNKGTWLVMRANGDYHEYSNLRFTEDIENIMDRKDSASIISIVYTARLY